MLLLKFTLRGYFFDGRSKFECHEPNNSKNDKAGEKGRHNISSCNDNGISIIQDQHFVRWNRMNVSNETILIPETVVMETVVAG